MKEKVKEEGKKNRRVDWLSKGSDLDSISVPVFASDFKPMLIFCGSLSSWMKDRG